MIQCCYYQERWSRQQQIAEPDGRKPLVQTARIFATAQLSRSAAKPLFNKHKTKLGTHTT